jgi:hypothetical protein
MKDGDLRRIFRYNLPQFQWTSIETAGVSSGVPDSEFCAPCGTAGWIEYKQTHKFFVQIKPLQVSWIDRRCRMGGRAWIAVRRTRQDGSDELWLMFGSQARALQEGGLENVYASCWYGGPGCWNWKEIETKLCTCTHEQIVL